MVAPVAVLVAPAVQAKAKVMAEAKVMAKLRAKLTGEMIANSEGVDVARAVARAADHYDHMY